MATSRVNPEIRPTRLNNVPSFAEVFVDHVPELEPFLQGRGDLEKGLEVQLQAVRGRMDTDPGSVEEICSFHQGQLQALARRPAEVALVVKLRQGFRAEQDLIARQPAGYYLLCHESLATQLVRPDAVHHADGPIHGAVNLVCRIAAR